MKKVKKIRILIMIALLSCPLWVDAWSLNRGVGANRSFPLCTAEKAQTVPELALGSDGQFLVVWNDQRNAELDENQRKFFDIYAAFVYSEDGRKTEPICVSELNRALDTYSRAAAAYNEAHDEFIICWSDQEKIYGQRLGSEAVLIGENFIIDECASGFITVTYNPLDPSYLMTYQGKSGGLRGMILESNGLSPYPSFQISGIGNAQQAVYNHGRNEFMVVYAAGVSRIMMRAVGSNGRVGPEIEVCDADFIQYFPTIAYNAVSEEYLIVWHDERNWEDYYNELYARSFNGEGHATSSEYRIVGGREDMLHAPHIAYDPVHHGYVLTWSRQHGYINYEFEIMTRRLDQRGRVTGDEVSLRSGATRHQDSSRIAFDPVYSRYLLVFEESQGLFDDGTDIYGQFLGAAPSTPRRQIMDD